MLHICAKRDDRWKRLPASCLIATQHPKPDGLAPDRWVQNISPDWYETGKQMGESILGGLSGTDAPAYVMIDELKAETITKVAQAAEFLKPYPQFAGKWGAYLVNGTAVSYAKLNPAIDRLLEANAIIACEVYLKMSLYKKQGDAYITQNMWGNSQKARARWLLARKNNKNSNSHIIGLLGLTPTYLDLPTGSGDFIRRMMHFWNSIAPGEPMGAWKWDLGAAIGVAPQWPGWNSKTTL